MIPTVAWIMLFSCLSVVYILSLVYNTAKPFEEALECESLKRVFIEDALRKTFSGLSAEELININISIPKDINDKGAIEINDLVEVMLKDGNLLIIGYFDTDNNYHSLIK